MTKTSLLRKTPAAAALAFGLALGLAHAQAPVSPQKQQLVDQLLQAQQPGVDQVARQLVEQPAVQLLQRAGTLVQRNVAADQQQAMAQALQGDVRKYAEETFPIVRDRARALAPATLGPMLAQQLTEAELQEVLAVFRSEAWRKFQAMGPEMQKALGDRLVADVKPQVEPRLRALDQTMARRLGLNPAAAASGPGR
jgi:hypothetical protein